MSFWNLSDNSNATSTGAEYEIGGGNLDPIPAGSSLLAAIDQISWKRKDQSDHNSPQYIEARWSILQPEQYKGRKIFHKIWVTDFDPNAADEKKALAKRDKARRMLAAIDANAGGKLSQNPNVPNDDQLGIALVGKPMVITLMEYEGQNGYAGGNWVSAVAPKTKEVSVAATQAKKTAAQSAYGSSYTAPQDDWGATAARPAALDEDSIPF